MHTAHDNTEKIALQILQSGVILPPLPTVLTRLLVLSRQPEDRIDVNKFTKLMQTDPALTTRILQLANSTYYGSLNKITNIRQAIMHIGLQETIFNVNWMLYKKIMPQFPSMEGFSDKDYWAHSWACATANKMLGRPDMMVSCLPGELYVTGLLHGIGKLILALHKPAEFRQCLENSSHFSQPLEESELDILGTTDGHIACEILKTWQFPASICNAVKYYKNPQAATEQYREIAALTQFAYYIANTSGIGNNGDEFSFDVTETYLAQQVDSPFANPEKRERLVNDIRLTLQNKSSTVTGESPAGSTNTPKQGTLEDFRASPTSSDRPKKISLFSKCCNYLRNIFN